MIQIFHDTPAPDHPAARTSSTGRPPRHGAHATGSGRAAERRDATRLREASAAPDDRRLLRSMADPRIAPDARPSIPPVHDIRELCIREPRRRRAAARPSTWRAHRPSQARVQPGAGRPLSPDRSRPAASGSATWTSCPFSSANAVRCRAQQLAPSSSASSSTRMRPSTMPRRSARTASRKRPPTFSWPRIGTPRHRIDRRPGIARAPGGLPGR